MKCTMKKKSKIKYKAVSVRKHSAQKVGSQRIYVEGLRENEELTMCVVGHILKQYIRNLYPAISDCLARIGNNIVGFAFHRIIFICAYQFRKFYC